MIRGVKAILLALFFAAIIPAITYAAPDDGDYTGFDAFQDKYVNRSYGYTVVIPQGLTAYRTKAPNPDHGTDILLGSGRHIFVNAEFDSLFYGSPEAALKAHAENDHTSGVKIKTAKLGKFNATEADYVGDDHVHKAVEILLTDSSPILYSVHLVTDQAHLAEDGGVFDQVAASFRKTKRE